jgi:hypothetical protein
MFDMRSIGKWERFLIKDIRGGRYRKWCADEGNKIKCNRGGVLVLGKSSV